MDSELRDNANSDLGVILFISQVQSLLEYQQRIYRNVNRNPVKTLHPDFPVTLGRRHLQPNSGHQYGYLQHSIHSLHYRDPHCGCHFYTVWRKDLDSQPKWLTSLLYRSGYLAERS